MKLPIPWSYTFLSDLDNCPHKAYRRFIAKNLPHVESDAMKWGITVHGQLAARLSGKPLPDETVKYEPYAQAIAAKAEGLPLYVEHKIGMTEDGRYCDFFGSPWGRGVIDVAVMDGSGNATILDWKTGKVREDPRELEIFGLLLRAKFPENAGGRITGHYVWLAEMRVGRSHDVSDTERTMASVQASVRRAEGLEPPWPKQPNPLCGFCPVLDCEHNRVKR